MILLRLLAAAVAVFGVVPLWRMLPARATGLAGVATADAAASYTALLWNGVLLALIPALIAAWLFDAERLEQWLRQRTAPLTRDAAWLWALGCAAAATGLAGLVTSRVFGGGPTLIDSFAQLTQARYFAAGRLAGPVLGSAQKFWHIQQTIITPHGWVSQYPPGYSALLALGFRLHALAWVGPVLLGVAAFFTALIADEVFENRAIARVASLLAAVSPFMLGMSAAYMSHVPACAFSCAALYFVLRARRGSSWWALAAGLSIGALFAVRPLTGIVAGVVAWLYSVFSPLRVDAKVRRVSLAVLGALPFLVLVGLYNWYFFGRATTFGYTAALGSHGGVGFGLDPWGNRFGPLESLAYTSAELAALNIFLLEVPLPLVLFVGGYFALKTERPTSGVQYLLFSWVAALLCANFFYWHHGLYMGPRMLADAGTLWVLLTVLATVGLITRIPNDRRFARKYSARAFAMGGVIAPLLAGMILLAPGRLRSYALSADVKQRLRTPNLQGPALVFVHGGWTSRIAMRLAGHGMRLDSVETALRQNGTCAAHHFAIAYERGVPSPVQLDFAPRADHLPRSVEVSPGDRIRVQPGEIIDGECAAEIASDRGGVVDVTPFIWQSALPGLGQSGPMFVRDMGPAENAALIAAHRLRVPLMLLEQNGKLALELYGVGLHARWAGVR